MNQPNHRMKPFVLAIIIALLACGPFTSTATEVVDTPSLEEMQTSVAQTVAALPQDQAGQGAVTVIPAAASDTPVVPTIPSAPTKTATNPSPCDKVEFVSETIPDGTDFAPSAAFTKTWRVRNIGTCTWDTSYDIVFDHGDTLGAPAAIPFPGSVAPGQEVYLSVNMTAPASAGTYSSFWKFRNGSDVIFVTNPFSTVIDVIGPTPTTGGIIIVTIPPILILRYTEQVVKQVSIPASSQASATANCTGAGVVTAGGFATSSNNMFVKSMFKSGSGWQAFGVNQLGSSQLLNSYVICLYNSGGSTSQVYEQVSVAAGTNGHATVACPGGSVVTGGGYASNAQFTVYNSSKSGNGWQVYARNNSGTSQLLNAYAICLAGTSATSSQVVEQTTIPASSTKGVDVECPSGSILTGGGFASSTDMLMYNTSMTSSTPSAWVSYARNLTGSSKLLNTYAICLTYP
ncbi:NBR1-Ig-like domain-containing protein [Chloroflexota bacterium]